jgi:hypothetical protein
MFKKINLRFCRRYGPIRYTKVATFKNILRGDQEGLFKLVTLNCILNRITGVTFGC